MLTVTGIAVVEPEAAVMVMFCAAGATPAVVVNVSRFLSDKMLPDPPVPEVEKVTGKVAVPEFVVRLRLQLVPEVSPLTELTVTMSDCAAVPAVPLVGENVIQLQLLGLETVNEVEVEAVMLTILEAAALNVNEVGFRVRPLLPLPPPPPLLELPLTDTATGTTTEVFAAFVEEKVTFAVLRPFARPVGLSLR